MELCQPGPGTHRIGNSTPQFSRCPPFAGQYECLQAFSSPTCIYRSQDGHGQNGSPHCLRGECCLSGANCTIPVLESQPALNRQSFRSKKHKSASNRCKVKSIEKRESKSQPTFANWGRNAENMQSYDLNRTVQSSFLSIQNRRFSATKVTAVGLRIDFAVGTTVCAETELGGTRPLLKWHRVLVNFSQALFCPCKTMTRELLENGVGGRNNAQIMNHGFIRIWPTDLAGFGRIQPGLAGK